MLYWDSSAIVASILNENISKEIDEFAKSFSSDCIYSAVMTPLEIESAIQRRLLEKSITEREADIARFTAAEFRKCVYLIASDFNVLDMALHMQKIYKLKPLDAIQLASARMGAPDPSRVHFLCLDRKLNTAAQREGLVVPFLE